jgi:hypothetical protein
MIKKYICEKLIHVSITTKYKYTLKMIQIITKNDEIFSDVLNMS